MRPGDWECWSCGANVFASKVVCFRCGVQKFAGGGTDSRAGVKELVGGGHEGDILRKERGRDEEQCRAMIPSSQDFADRIRNLVGVGAGGGGGGMPMASVVVPPILGSSWSPPPGGPPDMVTMLTRLATKDREEGGNRVVAQASSGDVDGSPPGRLLMEKLVQGIRDVADFIENNMDMLSPSSAVDKLHEVVRSVSDKQNKQKHGLKDVDDQDEARKGKPEEPQVLPHFGPNDATEVGAALRKLQDLVKKSGESDGANQIEVTFEKPVTSRLDIALRIEKLLGDGKDIPVELVGKRGGSWKKGSTSQWWAESGGDRWKVAFRLNVPGRRGHQKVSRVSIQYHSEVKELTLLGTRKNMEDFAVPWVVAFGPVSSVRSKPSSVAGTHDLAKMLGMQAWHK